MHGICKCGIGRTDGKMQKMHSLYILSMGRIVQRIEAETGCKPPSGHDGNAIADDGKLIAVR